MDAKDCGGKGWEKEKEKICLSIAFPLTLCLENSNMDSLMKYIFTQLAKAARVLLVSSSFVCFNSPIPSWFFCFVFLCGRKKNTNKTHALPTPLN